ncbi:hypothetical protein KW894_28395, partial [Klebsiella pneumoniae]|uniref:hypothetical protein n=2 Tax=Enterobacteriaceae TaxID=543 RepID=UPI001F053E95
IMVSAQARGFWPGKSNVSILSPRLSVSESIFPKRVLTTKKGHAALQNSLMPHRGMEAPAEARQGEKVDGRRDRRKPLRFERFCLSHPLPCKAIPANRHAWL